MKKNKNTIKRNIIAVSATIFLLTITSCGNHKNEDAKDVAEDQNKEKFEKRDSQKDAQFLVDVAEINLKEIELGKLAETKSDNPDVKNLGKMMVTEHTKALEDLKKLAGQKSITIPETISDDGDKECDKLSKEKTADFNKDYCDKMVNGHKDAIKKFEDAANDRNDEDIRAFAATMLPVLRMHLDHAIACQKKCDEKMAVK
jgi:putative membrane protein